MVSSNVHIINSHAICHLTISKQFFICRNLRISAAFPAIVTTGQTATVLHGSVHRTISRAGNCTCGRSVLADKASVMLSICKASRAGNTEKDRWKGDTPLEFYSQSRPRAERSNGPTCAAEAVVALSLRSPRWRKHLLATIWPITVYHQP